ncbi:peptide ABC transporter permease [Ktedonobacter sp. SOSP1-85]|uniref:ABC transporter permease n=1 Tax=Ktedonobacter sp. SOSP1-85 TaxID=2778367 RepID=UPI001915893D|nr:ABC transporter permease [Ktedonobacter sp. SOSP1-85]GHO73427.1 peptide ABC transporter permease [Ktedonobacter sp. SOSP1-85]
METRDKNNASPGMIAPDTAMPMESEYAVETTGKDGIQPDIRQPKKSPTPFQDSMRRLRRDKRAMISLAFLIFFIILPIIGPVIYQHVGGTYNSTTYGNISPQQYHDPFHQELDRQDENPGPQYLLGTDSVGRDLFARLMAGMLISITVAVVVEIITVVLGLTVGILAGFYGGWIDQLLARFTDIMFAFPGLLFTILLAGIFGSSADATFSHIPLVGANGNARLVLVSMALALVGWPFMARQVRGLTLQLREQQFVEAARTMGTTDWNIIVRHIVPNLFSIVIVQVTLDLGSIIINEAGLSYLGLGVQPPGSSIGLMINDASNLVDTHPWEVLLPSIVLTIIVLSFSFLGDGLRDAFDPRSKD